MMKTKLSENHWASDRLVVAVETMQVAGETVPISYSQITVTDGKIENFMFLPIACKRYFMSKQQEFNRTDAMGALAGADSLRQLTLEDLKIGESPEVVYDLVKEILLVAAKHEMVVVSHGASRGLEVIVTATENQLRTDLPILNVVCTGVLERARRAEIVPRDDESPVEFYQRIQHAPGELPDVVTCYREQEMAGGIRLPVVPSSRFFSVLVTDGIYRVHRSRHLKQARVATVG